MSLLLEMGRHLFIALVEHVCYLGRRELLYPSQSTADFPLLIVLHRLVIRCLVLAFFGKLVLRDHVV